LIVFVFFRRRGATHKALHEDRGYGGRDLKVSPKLYRIMTVEYTIGFTTGPSRDRIGKN